MEESADLPEALIFIIQIALAILKEQDTKRKDNEVEKGDIVERVKAVAESSEIEC